jgi:hypothetical protein
VGRGDTLVELDLQEAFAISAMFSRGNGDDVRYALTRGVALARSLADGDRARRQRLQRRLCQLRDLRHDDSTRASSGRRSVRRCDDGLPGRQLRRDQRHVACWRRPAALSVAARAQASGVSLARGG